MGSALDERSYMKVVLNDTHPGSFFQNNSALTSAPTNPQRESSQGIEDSELKVSKTLERVFGLLSTRLLVPD
jgi:hypothetical protein